MPASVPQKRRRLCPDLVYGFSLTSGGAGREYVPFHETAQPAVHNVNGCSESARADVREQLHTALCAAWQRLSSMTDPMPGGLTVGGSSATSQPISNPTALASVRQIAERVFGELAALAEAGGAPTPMSQSASGIDGFSNRRVAVDCRGEGWLSAGTAAVGRAVSLPAPSGCDGSNGLDSTRSLAAQCRSEAAAGFVASAMEVGDLDASRSSFCSGRSTSTSRPASGSASGRGALRRVTPVLLEAYLPSCSQPLTGVLNTGVALKAAGPGLEASGVAGAAASAGAVTGSSGYKTAHAGGHMPGAGGDDLGAGSCEQQTASGIAIDARPLPDHAAASVAAVGDGLLLGLCLDLPSPHPQPAPCLPQSAITGPRSHERERTHLAECSAQASSVHPGEHFQPRRLTPQLVPQLQQSRPACAGSLFVDDIGDVCTDASGNVCAGTSGCGSVTSRSSSRASRRIQPQQVAPAPDAFGV